MGRGIFSFPLITIMALTFFVAACDDNKGEKTTAEKATVGAPDSKEATEQTAPKIELGPAVAYATAEGSKTGAVFLKISNLGDANDTLVGVTATVGTSAEMHITSIDEDGTAQMRKMPRGFKIDANSHFVLNPTGPHIMLFGLTKPLKEGDTFNVTLDFAVSEDMTVPVKVMTLREAPPVDGQNPMANHKHQMMPPKIGAPENHEHPTE